MSMMWFAFALLASPARSETVEEIIDQARDAQKIDSSIQQARMTILSKNGTPRVREFSLIVRKDGDTIQSYTRFSSPSDVAGTQLLMIDNPDTNDEQLMYLPAFDKMKRIAGKARKGKFMGSDFAFEDLELSDASSSNPQLVSQSDTVWVIDTQPSGDSSYGRIRLHVSRSDYLPRIIEFFDHSDEAMKRLDVLRTDEVGGVVLPTHSRMRNLQSGTSTLLEVEYQKLDAQDCEPGQTELCIDPAIFRDRESYMRANGK